MRLGRLTRSEEFQRLRRGKRVDAEFGRLQGISRPCGPGEAAMLRFGLVVPKRLGNAPQRNRIKRRLRDGMRAQLGGKRRSVPTSMDVGIFPTARVLAMDFEALVAQLDSSLAGLMRKLGQLPI